MPANTPLGFTYPLGTDPPAGHTQMQELATDIDTYLAAMPQGIVAYAQVTANQGAITTMTDLTGLSVTFTATAGRRYKISANANAASTVAGDLIIGWITDGNGVGQSRFLQVSGQSGGGSSTAGSGFAVVTPAAGPVTYKLRMERSLGSGTITNFAGVGYPSAIVVEDGGAI